MTDQKTQQMGALNELDPYCLEHVRGAGYLYFFFWFYVPIDPAAPTRFVMTNYPQAWMKKYGQSGHLRVDPIMERVLSGIEPFQWSSLQTADPAVTAMFRDAASFGLRDGISVPLHAPGGAKAGFSMAGLSTPPPGSAQLEQQLREAMMFSNRIFARVLEMAYKGNGRRRRGVGLTHRQSQVVSAMAQGVTFREIADDLGISPETVKSMSERIIKKLGVRNREQAIVRAVLTGYVHLPSSSSIAHS